MNGHDEGSGRETRLLLLVIVVALVVLVVLARFRFPSAELAAVTPGPGPLERLAQRASYDDLGRAIADLVERLGPAVVVIELQPDPARGRRGAAAAEGRLAAAVRVRPDLALLYVPEGFRVGGAPGAVAIVGADEAHGLILVRVDARSEGAAMPSAAPAVGPFSYVAAVEAAMGGPTARPVFLGRIDEDRDAAWSAPMLVPGGDDVRLTAGTWLFDLNGRLIGLVVRRGAGVGIVRQPDLDAIVRALGGTVPQETDGPHDS